MHSASCSRLVRVVVRRALDLDVLFILGGERGADRRIVRRRHRVVGLVDDLQHRRRLHQRGVHRPLGVGLLVGPLRQPRAQRGIAREPGRRRVRDARIAEEAPVRLAAVRIDRRVDPAHVAHGAVDHEGALHLAVVPALRAYRACSSAQSVIFALRARCAARNARDEFRRERRLVRAFRHRRCRARGRDRPGSSSSRTEGSIHSVRVSARLRCAAMKMMPSAGDRLAARQVVGIPGRRLRDGRTLGLPLVEQRERAAARPADQHDLA